MDIFSIFFDMNVRCVFSLESPHQGDSDEYTNIPFSIYKKNTLNYRWDFFPWGSRKQLETGVVNESSVFEPLKVYCNMNVLFSVGSEIIHFETIGRWTAHSAYLICPFLAHLSENKDSS